MEAMVAGVPVVGSDAIGLREVLKNTPSYIPTAGDPQELAQSILSAALPESQPRAESFVQQACERFQVDNAVERLAELYGEQMSPR